MLIMVLLVLTGLWALVAYVWTLVIIFRNSTLGGILTFLFWWPVLYFLVKGWGEEGRDIRFPFFAGQIPFLLVLLWAVTSTGMQGLREFEAARSSLPAASERMRDTTVSTPRETAPTTYVPVRTMTEPTRSAPPPQYRTSSPPQIPQAQTQTQAQIEARERQRRKTAQSGACVYKPVMTDEDMAKCR